MVKRVQFNISLFLPLLVSTSVYLLIVGEQVIVVLIHPHSIGLFWMKDRPATEIST
jgi:hypothetical protein